jgi:hypothetical protein
MVWYLKGPVIALTKGYNRVRVSLPSAEDEKKYSFRNDVFSSYLEFRTMGKVQKLVDSENLIFD